MAMLGHGVAALWRAFVADVHAVGGWFRGAWDAVAGWVGGVEGSAMGVVRAVGGWFKGLGKDVAGLRSGFASAIERLMAWCRSLAG